MANYELSRNTVSDLLSDNIQISPNTNEKLDYFRRAIKMLILITKKSLDIVSFICSICGNHYQKT